MDKPTISLSSALAKTVILTILPFSASFFILPIYFFMLNLIRGSKSFYFGWKFEKIPYPNLRVDRNEWIFSFKVVAKSYSNRAYFYGN